MEEKRELWERQPHESSEAYKDFCLYRDLGPQRKVSEVCKLNGKEISNMCQQQKRHKWLKRAQAWDDYIEKEARKKMERDIILVKRSALSGAMRMAQLSLARLKDMKAEDLTVKEAKEFMRNALAIAQSLMGNEQAEEEIAKMPEENDVVVYLPEIESEVIADKKE